MPPRLTAIEFLVTDLDRALELLVDRIGFPLAQRTRHARFDADVVVLEADPLALVLVSPTETGNGIPIPVPGDGITQLVFEPEDRDAFLSLRERLVVGGAAVANDGEQMFHLSTTLMESVFGVAPPLVFATEADPAWTGAPQPPVAGPGGGDQAAPVGRADPDGEASGDTVGGTG